MENVDIIRSGRKTVAIEITRDCRVVVRAPYRMDADVIRRMVEEKAGWIIQPGFGPRWRGCCRSMRLGGSG